MKADQSDKQSNQIYKCFDELSVDSQVSVLQSLLFVSGVPKTSEELAIILNSTEEKVECTLAALSIFLEKNQSGVMIREVNKKYGLTIKPINRPYIESLYEPKQLAKLSNAAYEVLAVIAYNQPVTRQQIEVVRGVNSDHIISTLLQRGYIEHTGFADVPGKPALFEVTDTFLLDMGLSSVEELEPMELMMYNTLQEFEQSILKEKESGQAVEKYN